MLRLELDAASVQEAETRSSEDKTSDVTDEVQMCRTVK